MTRYLLRLALDEIANLAEPGSPIAGLVADFNALVPRPHGASDKAKHMAEFTLKAAKATPAQRAAAARVLTRTGRLGTLSVDTIPDAVLAKRPRLAKFKAAVEKARAAKAGNNPAPGG